MTVTLSPFYNSRSIPVYSFNEERRVIFITLALPYLQEKQRAKVKEKLDKCVKDKLLEFCDVLDIPVVKTAARKVDSLVLCIGVC